MTIPAAVTRQLFASSGGYCQNPACRIKLFEAHMDGASSVAERAHVIGKKSGSPRALRNREQQDLDVLENLILLCSRCHTEVDQNEERFPAALLRRWKAEHEAEIAAALGADLCDSRATLNKILANLLAHNRDIHRTFGPESIGADEWPTVERVNTWRRRAAREVIPNNRRILALLRSNANLLSAEERQVVEQFASHAMIFEQNQLSDRPVPNPTRFPHAIYKILTEM